MVPVGRLTFQFLRAVSTSFRPIWCEASLCGSICACTAYFWAPSTCTCATPLTMEMRCATRVSATVPLWTLDEYAETRVAQRISMVSGVAQVQVLGSQKFAVHAQLDPHALAARQIGIN